MFNVNIQFHLDLYCLVYLSCQPAYVYIHFGEKYPNMRFTDLDVFQLNGVAYDFYSVNELRNGSKIGLQWKSFPLPDEHIPAYITPWTPYIRLKNTMNSDYKYPSMQSTTGLAFVDRIYIVTTAKLKDRQANLRKMFKQYDLHDYEWRMKWTRNHCTTLEYKSEIDTKLNLRGDFLCKSVVHAYCDAMRGLQEIKIILVNYSFRE